MNQMTASEATDGNVVELAESPGRRLRVQRQSRGIEIERIAAQLHLRTEIVAALEQDRYDALPAPVYVAGYLRNYARLLGLDPLLIVNAYYAATPHTDERTAAVTAVHAPRRDTRSSPFHSGTLLVRLLGLAVALALIVALTLWWQSRADQETAWSLDWLPAWLSRRSEQTQENPVATEPEADTASPATDFETPEPVPPEPILAKLPRALPAAAIASAPPASVPPTPLPVPDATPPVDAPEPAPLATARPLPAETAEEPDEPQPATSAAAEVVLEFTGASWISVMGSDGNIALNGEMRAGDRRVLAGKPPYKFVIGNASATRITISGQAFDLAGRTRGNVARFTLDPLKP